MDSAIRISHNTFDDEVFILDGDESLLIIMIDWLVRFSGSLFLVARIPNIELKALIKDRRIKLRMMHKMRDKQ